MTTKMEAGFVRWLADINATDLTDDERADLRAAFFMGVANCHAVLVEGMLAGDDTIARAIADELYAFDQSEQAARLIAETGGNGAH